MKYLTIVPGFHQTVFRMRGLSLKVVNYHDFCKDETGFYLSNDFVMNGKTAQIQREALIIFLKHLYNKLPFDGIKIKGRYEVSGEYLFNQVKPVNP